MTQHDCCSSVFPLFGGMGMAKKRIALIGMGSIAQKVYAPLLAWNEQVEVAGIMSRTSATVEALQRKYRFPAGTTSLNALLGWGVDAVFVHSPTETHADIVTACLQAGVAVYVDKPLSYSLQESVQMAALAEKRGLLLGVGFNRRFAPLYVEAAEWLASGFRLATVQKHRTRQQQLSAKQTVYDDLIHMLDLILWLAGSEGDLASSSLAADPMGRMQHASGMLTFGDASSAAFSMVRDAGADLEQLELHGHGKSVIVTNMDDIRLYEKDKSERRHGFGSWETTWERRGFVGVIAHFLAAIDHPEQCQIRADLVLPSHRLAEKIGT